MSGTEQSRTGAAAARGDRQFATFYANGLLFGVEVVRVQEVLRYQEMTPVPRAPEVIEGLINLRGQIVTAIDARRRLGLPAREADRTPMNMVIRSDDGAVSLLVDEIGDVLDVEQAAFEPVPENVAPSIRDLTTGVYKLKERLLLVLDTGKAVDVGSSGPRVRTH
jgi:purine-binding chemotaxis protein CheW